ncbi:MAG TPA: ABC transporter substrate-binding protein [Candidatus Pygmaiobacter gallistercoris]|nr:ABC transporter substrate-binding protein [Candidatus Pygmaiobacter gallistercoris]
MKKLIALVLSLALAASTLAGCGGSGSSSTPSSTPDSSSSSSAAVEPTDIRIAGLKGPTSMGMVKLMEDAENGEAANNYTFTIAGSADEVTPKLIQGDYDIAAVPANLASVLYNNTEGAIKLLAINTLGVIYIVEKGDSVQSLSDLAGKTIYATGKGSTPEYAFNYILSENGLDPATDVTVEWKTEPTEVVQVLAQSDSAVAMLPQPYVTVAQNQVEGLRVAVDLNQSWSDLDNGSLFLTGVLVVRSEFAEQHPEQLAAFLKEYQASTEWVNANVSDAAQLVEKFDIVAAAVAEKAIPYCNITYIAGDEMKTAMDGYLKVLYDQDPKSVGGTLPAEDFYCNVG